MTFTSQMYFQYLNIQMLQAMNDTLNQTAGNSTVIDSNMGQEGVLAMIYPIISSLYFNVIFMGLCASLISFTITLIIERAGSRVGGVIGSIPTAVVPSTLGFALDALFKFGQDSTTRQHVMTRGFYTIPIGTFMTAIFLLCWKVLPPLLDRYMVQRWRRFVSNKIEQLTNNEDDEKSTTITTTDNETNDVSEVTTNTSITDDKESLEVSTTAVEETLSETQDQTNMIVLSEKDESPIESSPTTIIQIESSSTGDELNQPTYPAFQIKMWQALGADGFIKVMSGLLVCFLGVAVWTAMASTYMAAISLIQWRDEIHIAISVLCFVATLILALFTSWSYNVYKPMTQVKNTNSSRQTAPPTKKFKKSRLFIFALRIVLPFCLVSISVLLNAMQLTLLAGLFASFPTIYMTTLFTLWIGNEDESLAVESVGPMMLGSCSVSLYAMIACPTMFAWNLLAGAFVAYGCAIVGINIPAFFYLRWRKIVGEKRMKNNAQLLIEEGDAQTSKLQSLKLQNISPVQSYEMSNMEYTYDDMEISEGGFSSNKLSTCNSMCHTRSVDSISSLESHETCSIERTHSSESLESVISDIDV